MRAIGVPSALSLLLEAAAAAQPLDLVEPGAWAGLIFCRARSAHVLGPDLPPAHQLADALGVLLGVVAPAAGLARTRL